MLTVELMFRNEGEIARNSNEEEIPERCVPQLRTSPEANRVEDRKKSGAPRLLGALTHLTRRTTLSAASNSLTGPDPVPAIAAERHGLERAQPGRGIPFDGAPHVVGTRLPTNQPLAK